MNPLSYLTGILENSKSVTLAKLLLHNTCKSLFSYTIIRIPSKEKQYENSTNPKSTVFWYGFVYAAEKYDSKKIGSYAAEHAETARYKLELLAKDVDIEVTPKRALGEDARYDQFDIWVTEISQPQNNFRERLLNFIRFPKYESSTVYVFEDYPGKPLFQTIIEKTTQLKEKLLQ